MGTVHSLNRQRSKHDDGRCHEPGCDGVYRIVCPYRGQHPVECAHSRVDGPRHYLLWGFLDQVAPPRCRDCGEHLYDLALSTSSR